MSAADMLDLGAPAIASPTVGGADVPPKPATKPAGKTAAKKATKKAPAADKAPAGPGRPTNAAKLEAKLAETIATVAIFGTAASAATGQTGPGTIAVDFEIIAGQAEPLAAALVKLGERNPAVLKVLNGMVTSSAYGELLTVVLGGIVLPIAINHGAGKLFQPGQQFPVDPADVY